MRALTEARALVLACVALLSCGDSEKPAPACTTVDLNCTPAYEPTFDQVFAKTLKPSCAKTGPSCHNNVGKRRGLIFEDPDTAYQLLQQQGVVHGGDAACSEVVVKVTSTDPLVRMPPAASIPLGEQCAIVHWVQDGAKR
jgi:hypothetical protein